MELTVIWMKLLKKSQSRMEGTPLEAPVDTVLSRTAFSVLLVFSRPISHSVPVGERDGVQLAASSII